MTRGMTAAMETEAQASWNQPIWFLRLDIDTDPVLIWTGYGDYTPSGTGDTAFDSQTFSGIGTDFGDIGPIRDTSKGSDAVRLSMPGVDLTEPLLKQVIADSRLWQYRRAWIWTGYFDTNLSVVADPTRIKTGRIDNMTLSRSGGIGSVEVTIESHQAYINRSIVRTYNDQDVLDASDTSMDFIYDLVNKKAGAGEETTFASGGVVNNTSSVTGATSFGR